MSALVIELNKRLGTKLTDRDYGEWLESWHDLFDDAVTRLLGPELYCQAAFVARLDAVLQYYLLGGEQVIGGINLQVLIDKYGVKS